MEACARSNPCAVALGQEGDGRVAALGWQGCHEQQLATLSHSTQGQSLAPHGAAWHMLRTACPAGILKIPISSPQSPPALLSIISGAK